MSKLGELIAELCPNGVKYVKIKDCFNRLKGTPITAGKMKEIENKNGDIRVFAGGKTVINAKEEDIPNANITRVPAVLVQSRGVIDVVYFESPFTFKNEMWAYTHEKKATVKYLFYVLKSNIQSFRDSASGMGSLPQISLPVTEEFIIPLPPLPVQEEIVRILDSFTELTAELTRELTTELTARKKQYEYYRDDLLTFGDNVPIVALGEVTQISSGRYKEKQSAGVYPVYGSTGAIGYADNYVHSGTSILVARVGANCGFVYQVDGDYNVSDNTLILTLSEKCSYRYAYHLLTNMRLNRFAKGGGQPLITAGQLKAFSIPLPSLIEQGRIVSILDRFDTLCNDISSGLPAEIKARQQQYEYYRDKLLTFKKKEA